MTGRASDPAARALGASRAASARAARVGDFRDWPLFWKLMAVFTAVFLAAGSGVLLLGSRAAQERAAAVRLTDVEFAGIGLVLNIDRDAYQASLGLNRAALATDSAERRKWLAFYGENRAQMATRLGTYGALPGLDAPSRERAAAADLARSALVQAGDSVAARLRAGAGAAAVMPGLALVQTRLDTLHEVLGGAEETHQKASAELSETVRDAALSFQRLTWIGLFVFLLVGILVAWFMTRELAAPLARLALVSERIARGDLAGEPVALGRGDEVGRLAASFDRMVPYLRDVIARIQLLSAQVGSSSEQIAATARDTSQSLTQLNVAVEQITQGAQEQAQAAQETAEVVVDMSGAIERVAGGAAGIASDAGEAVSVARRGGDTVQQAIGSMDDVRQAVVEAASVLSALGERTQRIGQIVEVISQIAGRTNLLALNAAIEAARAGEHGRGFAVVADEVRKLADGSQKSAAEIATLIAGIEQGTREAVGAMEAGVARVEHESVVAGQAMTALADILAAVEATGSRVGSIAEEAERLTQNAQRVASLVQDVASVAQESAASAEEMSAQSLQVASAMLTIAPSGEEARDESATGALRQVAEELQGVAATFRT